MVQTYQPPLMDVGEDTIPELQPIFSFLNSHSNKLYQEGYFLKLDDQNSRTLLPNPIVAFPLWLRHPLPPNYPFREMGKDTFSSPLIRALC